MSSDELARQDFERALSRAFWRRLVRRLTGESNELLSFDEVRERLPVRGQHYLGLHQVPIDLIVGSMGRYRDFDRAFLPIQERTKDRWLSIDRAHYEEIPLPPVDLYKIGEIYFVKDGNHRVSVARERGQLFLDAHVTEIDIPVVLSPDTSVNDLAVKQELASFILQTQIDHLRPEARIMTSLPGQVETLLKHIEDHRYFLGLDQKRDIAYEEAVASWYDHVYLPLVDVIREQGIVKDFPGSTETDLYLWVMEYQGYLRQAYKEDYTQQGSVKEEVARHLVDDYPHPAVRKLIGVLNRAGWMDELILRQEQAAFLKQTRLNELRPQAGIAITLPGQYGKLREHIAVHRYYLGEQRGAEVPYSEAVASWYDQVYLPLVEIIREQGILEHFPQRTETDLYLWVIEHQWYLREAYGGDVPAEQAAGDFVKSRAKGWLRRLGRLLPGRRR